LKKKPGEVSPSRLSFDGLNYLNDLNVLSPDSAVSLKETASEVEPGVAKAPTVNFQSHFALSHFVVTSFNVPSKHLCSMSGQRQTASPPQADQPSAEALLRKGCASRFPVERNCGIRLELMFLY
jgi:hypothetical protein